MSLPIPNDEKQRAMALRSITLCLWAVMAALYVTFFSITAAIAQTTIDGPFGLSTVVAPEGPLSVMWRELLLQVNNDLSIIAQCRSDPQSCSSPAALKFLAIVKEGEQHEGRPQIAHINRASNFALRALNSAHGDDEWRPPLVALFRGAGDCKHYAALKYAALREVGVPQDAVKIVIVQSRSTHQQHAVIAVRIEERWLLLDNHSSTLIESLRALDYFDPLYTLDKTGVRQFALPSRPEQIVSSIQRTPALARTDLLIKNN